MFSRSFLSPEETALATRFLTDGFVILPVEDPEALASIRDAVVRMAWEAAGGGQPIDSDAFLNGFHERLTVPQLNQARLAVYKGLNDEDWARPAYYSLAKSALQGLVGNELCMQRRLNLSIQLPGDDSSLLPVHADVLSGDSPYEVVLWVPLVDCRRTKSMFILPPEPNAEVMPRLAEFSDTAELMEAISEDLVWIDIAFGQYLLFNQNLLHGNVINAEADTRWSLNCRFKGVFTPYGDKRIGEFFEPITLRAASRIGLTCRFPGATDT